MSVQPKRWLRLWEHQPPVPAHRATTRNLRGVMPLAPSSFGGGGVYIGVDPQTGASFCYDPWVLYGDELFDANAVILGNIGSGKSSLCKTYLWRQTVFGRRTVVLSPKPRDYDRYAAACGVDPVQIYPGGPHRLNPLDTSNAGGTGGLQQLNLLVALAEAAAGRTVTPRERNAIRQARDAAAAHPQRRELTIPDVVDRLLHPTPEMADASAATVTALADEARDVALALNELVQGALAGMFDGPTTASVDLSAQTIVFDLSRLHGSTAMGMLMTCLAAALTGQMDAGKANTILVLEEAWAALSDLGMARYFQQATKLSRTYGLQCLFLLHKLSDLRSVGAAGSQQAEIAHNLIADCGTKIIYSQDTTQLDATKRVLQLPDRQAQTLRGMTRGRALWLVGDARRATLVDHILGDDERVMVDTDDAMRQQPRDDMEVAV